MKSSSIELRHSPREWKRVRGELHIETSGPFRRVFYTRKVPRKRDQAPFTPVRFLFISDLHLSLYRSTSILPGILRWKAEEALLEFILETVSLYKVHHLLFGGDLLTFLCGLDKAVDFLRQIRVPGRKIGVYGNWDLKRSWMPCTYWEKLLEKEASMELLCNRAADLDGIRIYGMDEFRAGTPVYEPLEKPVLQNWILTHNPDAVPAALSQEDLLESDLILCGHTHGGQIRLPFFGAIQTSSIFWKHFEYGLYRHQTSGSSMLLTSGLGSTLIPLRVLCPPEAVIVDVIQDPAWSGDSTEA